MGVGMNAANQVVGAIGAVGVASRMIGEEKNQALAQGSAAFQQRKEDEIEAAKIDKEIGDEALKAINTQKDVDTLRGMAKDPKNNGLKTRDD